MSQIRSAAAPQVLLDVTRLLTRSCDGILPTGVDRVGLAYIERYGPHARAVVSKFGLLSLLSEHESRRIFDLLLSGKAGRKAVLQAYMRALLPQRSERWKPSDRAVLLHTSHTGMEFRRYYAALGARNIRSVFMVHDLIPITHAEYCRPGMDVTHRRRIHAALEYADGLIANSRTTLNALASEAAYLGKPLPPSTVAYLAPAVYGSPSPEPPPLDKPYFVMLGTIEARKNHWLMLHVWRRLTEQFGSAAPLLVIIGRRGWECENTLDMLERCVGIRDSVIEETNCPDERMRKLLSGACALLFPSFVEGYGMPLVEALSMGVPVIASDIDVFREIAPDIPDYIDPLDGPRWLAQIISYSTPNSAEREAQLRRIRGFEKPTWEAHFSQVDAFLASIN
ncbi:glycosyltransferase family 4 protein [Burkholderia cenocepacia]